MAQQKSKTIAVALILATLVVATASEPEAKQAPLVEEIRTSCTVECDKEHKDPAETKNCVELCVFSSKYLMQAYETETMPTKRVGKFKILCNEGCSKEYKDPAIFTKCVENCDEVAKELAENIAKIKI